jgi:hypothetical protein
LIKRLLPEGASRHQARRRFPDEMGYVTQVATAVREPGGCAGGAVDRRPALACAGMSAAGGALDPPDGRARQVREWLFLLLRFAITRDPEDEHAVLMAASGFDSLGRQWGRAAPTFFRRSSEEVCEAIRALDDPGREAILKKHILRIEHPGLRRAFQAAVHCQQVRAATS